MDIFVSALENYPIQTGFILIGFGVIIFLFTIDNSKKKNFWGLTPSNKKARIYVYALIVGLFIIGFISIFKNI